MELGHLVVLELSESEQHAAIATSIAISYHNFDHNVHLLAWAARAARAAWAA